MAKITVVEDNSEQIMHDEHALLDKILEMIGMNAEKYAKALCPVGTSESTGKQGYHGGTLRDSITHEVDTTGDVKTVTVGSNVEYAPYVELGTGPHFTPPPEWEQFDVPKGSGIGHSYVRPRPYIKPAITDHIKEYENIIKSELSNN